MCRLRFYLFKPNHLRSFLSLPDRQFQPQPNGLEPAEADSRPIMAWELLRQNASDSQRHP